MNYTTLIAGKSTAGSIASWANYGLAPVEVILDEAQALIYQRLRVREMKSGLVTLTLTQSNPYVALPDDWIDPIAVFNEYNKPLTHREEVDLVSRRGKDGAGALVESRPCAYAVFDDKIQFDCAADSALEYATLYYKTPALLSGSNTTNFLTRRYPTMLRTACLAMAADFRKDTSDYTRNVQRLEALIADIKVHDDLANTGVVVDADYSRV